MFVSVDAQFPDFGVFDECAEGGGHCDYESGHAVQEAEFYEVAAEEAEGRAGNQSEEHFRFGAFGAVAFRAD